MASLAASAHIASSASLLSAAPSLRPCSSARSTSVTQSSRRPSLAVRASAKLPGGVEEPKVQPSLPKPFWGFTENAEVWNSRAAMIGFFGILAIEFVTNQGLLQLLGVEVGKGLDLPL